MEQVRSWWLLAWDVLAVLGAVALVAAWVWGAVFLWNDGMRIFSGLIAAALVAGFVLAWRSRSKVTLP